MCRNDEIRDLILTHCKRYPSMQTQDAVKLLFQTEFGGGHMITDSEDSLLYLLEELEGIKDIHNRSMTEPLIDGRCRLQLHAVAQECSVLPNASGIVDPLIRAINRIFVASSKQINGTVQDFEEKLTVLSDMAEAGLLPFTAEQLRAYMNTYRAEGFPPVHHSGVYRKLYSPAYILVLQKYMPYLYILTSLENLFDLKDHVIVGIDGNSASGKSELASLLSELYDCSIIHMDDFYLPQELRTEDRLQRAGGNIHHERFREEIALKLDRFYGKHMLDMADFSTGSGDAMGTFGTSFLYRKYDSKSKGYLGTGAIEPKPLIIIEGVYALHPRHIDIFDYRLFLRCSEKEQRKRIIARDGEEAWKQFETEWIPMEQKYFSTYDIARYCDMTVDTTYPVL